MESEQLNWNFQKGWGKEQTHINSQWPGECGNFLDLHIILKVNRLHCTYFWHPQLSTTYQIPFAYKKIKIIIVVSLCFSGRVCTLWFNFIFGLKFYFPLF